MRSGTIRATGVAIWLACVGAPWHPVQAAAPPVSCLSPGIGAPACASGAPLGGAVDPARAGRHVGNPIEVASGNKYQREVEYRDVGSGLALVRHYNSLLADEDIGLGPGWRHGFQASLGRLDGSTLQLIQADGRRIAFERLPGTDAPEVYRGPSPAFGSLYTNGSRTSWHPGDGRRLDFAGPLLARIEFGDTRGGLSMLYAYGRLAEVRSDRGRRMRFRYVTAAESVQRYGEDSVPPPTGALSAIELPDGGVVRFSYDWKRRLVGSELPGGETIRYGYDDPSGLALLTSRQGTDAADRRRWRYDGDGLAVASSGAAGLEIERRLDGHESGSAALSWNDGRQETLSWDTPADLAGGTEAPRARRPGTFDDLLGAALVGLEQLERRAVDPSDARSHWRTVVPLGGRRARMTFTTDRHGTVDELRVGGADANMLLLRWGTGQLAACAEGRARGTAASERLAAVALGASPCANDALLLASFQRELQRGVLEGVPAVPASAEGPATGPIHEPLPAFAPRRGTRPGKYTPKYPPQPDVPRAPEPDPCAMPAHKDCRELHEDLDMAYLSECAYAIICRSAWVPVSPQEVGLTDLRLSRCRISMSRCTAIRVPARTHSRFAAPTGWGTTGRTISIRGADARRGSTSWRTGWLADLKAALPGVDLSFTGHSLGGGLATFAAVSTGLDATVFNAASLHPTTADREGLLAEYDSADTHVDLMTTWSDPITEVNRVGHNWGSYEGRVAPGAHTVLADPSDEWVRAWPRSWLKPDDTLVYHSMAGVIKSLETTLEKHCGLRR